MLHRDLLRRECLRRYALIIRLLFLVLLPTPLPARTLDRGVGGDRGHARMGAVLEDRRVPSLRFTRAFAPGADTSWREISLPEFGFAITMPADTGRGRTSFDEDHAPDIIRISSRSTNLSISLYSVNDEHVIINDSSCFLWIMALEGMPRGPRYARRVSVQGYTGFDFSDNYDFSNNYYEHDLVRGRVVFRGNRGYLMKSYMPETGDSSTLNRFVESFRFIDPAEAAWRAITIDSLGISTLVPATPSPPSWRTMLGTDSLSYVVSDGIIDFMNAYDTASSLLYGISCMRVAPYSWLKDTAAIKSLWPINFIGALESPISRSTYTIGACPAEEQIFSKGNGDVLVRIKTVLVGHSMIRALLVVSAPDIHSNVVDRFFSSFVPIDSMRGTDLFVDRIPYLLRDLRTADPKVAATIRAALPGISFTAKEVPTILAALDDPLPDDTAMDGRRRLLLSALEDMARGGAFGDVADSAAKEAIAAKVSSLLPRLKEWPLLRAQAMKTLMGIGTPRATSSVIEDLGTPDADMAIDGPLAMYLTRVIRQLDALVLVLLRRIDSMDDPVPLLILAADCADSLPRSLLVPMRAELARAAISTAAKPGRLVGWRMSLETAARVLAYVPRSDTAVVLLRALEENPRWDIRLAAQCALLAYGESIDTAALETMAADARKRWTVYDRLSQIGWERMFPERYRAAGSLAESAIVQDREVNVENRAPVAERDERLNGGDYRIEVFKVARVRGNRDDSEDGAGKEVMWYPAVVVLKTTDGDIDGRIRPVIWYGDEIFDPATIEAYVSHAGASIGKAAE